MAKKGLSRVFTVELDSNEGMMPSDYSIVPLKLFRHYEDSPIDYLRKRKKDFSCNNDVGKINDAQISSENMKIQVDNEKIERIADKIKLLRKKMFDNDLPIKKEKTVANLAQGRDES